MRRAAAGEDVLNATLGALREDDGSPSVMRAVAEAMGRIAVEVSSQYAPISGPQPFLDAVMDDLLGGTPLRAQAVAVATAGGTGACHHAIANFLEPGQKLFTSSHYWGPYAIIAEHARRGLATFNMFAEDGTFDLAAFERGFEALLDEQGRALVILNTPCHNPTGYSLNDEEWRFIIDVLERGARRAPVTLLLDHAYAKFAAAGADPWLEHVPRLIGSATVLIAWTASKAFCQYGARIGSLIAIHSDAEERQRIKFALGYSCRGTWSNCNHLGMLAVTECLSDPKLRAESEAERKRLRALLHERVDAFKELAAKAGLRIPRYEGGFFVVVFTNDPGKTAAAMRERGVFVVPLSGAVRVGLCATPKASLPRLVAALADCVDSPSISAPSAR